jgi:hypothetical protein
LRRGTELPQPFLQTAGGSQAKEETATAAKPALGNVAVDGLDESDELSDLLCGHAVKVDGVRGAHQLRSDLLGARRERAAGARKSAAANCILISRMSWK